MRAPLKVRFCIEAGLAALSGFLCLLTLVWRDWIEAVFGVDPDHHSGSLEWAIVATLLGVAAVSSILALAEWPTRRQVPAGGLKN